MPTHRGAGEIASAPVALQAYTLQKGLLSGKPVTTIYYFEPIIMDNRTRTLQELDSKSSDASKKKVLVGLDGFVDKLVTPVAERRGSGENFTPISTITEFADRIRAAAGNSTNIEFAPKVEKLGGNGPIMANSLLTLGVDVRYIGSLGWPDLHPVFEDFAKATNAVSIAEPGITHGAEFDDGKILFGTMTGLEDVTYQRVIDVMTEGQFFDSLSRAHLIALVNWTMLPYMTQFMVALLDRVLPNLNTLEPRQFFFDLADPSKRSKGDIHSVLRTIKRFQSFGNVTLGLNFAEALQVDQVLFKRDPIEPSEKPLRKMVERIRSELEIGCVVVHPTDSAACATREDSYWVAGPFCEKPCTTTGAGDHFNAGFALARLLELSPVACLTLAVACSGYYVRTGRSPSLQNLDSFIRDWNV